jgi:hypothetical protein
MDSQMTDKTPQEKKRLSYLKDRRNTYGENDKRQELQEEHPSQ